jgi:tetratricopeptide (TPR) repeat protein
MKKRCLILCLALCCLVPPTLCQTEAGAAETQPALLHSLLRQGIEKSFNLEMPGALDLFQRAMELDRGNPLGHAFLALAHLFSYEMSFDTKTRTSEQEAMLRAVTEALTQGKKRLDANARDGQAYFAVSLAKIVKIRWAINQKQYLAIAQETANMWAHLEKVRTEDPQNYDVYFPMGLLHYHLDHLPAAARFFSSLLITASDHQKGIQELTLAAQKGDLLREMALAELASVYTFYEGQPAQALPLAQALKERFPRNYNFSIMLSLTLSELRRFPEAFAVAGEIEKGIQSAKDPYVPQLQPRLDHLLGRLLFNQGDYDRAADYFRKALTDTSIYNARNRVSALVRLGMIQDLRNQRKQAEEFYRNALEVESGEGISQTEARKYLKTPYALRPNATTP